MPMAPKLDGSWKGQMKVYPASKSRHWPFWSALRAAGIPIVASWVDAEFNHTGGEPPDWCLHWMRCVEEAAAADVVLMYADKSERQMGALIEVGAALAAGARVFLVSPHPWSWRHHPQVRCFETLADAIAAIKELNTPAAAAGDHRQHHGRDRSRRSRGSDND
jgi:hypothetical protein